MSRLDMISDIALGTPIHPRASKLNQGYRNRYNIIDHGHKKYFYIFFQRSINFGVYRGRKYPFLTFFDKWCQATVGKAGWIFNAFLSRGYF